MEVTRQVREPRGLGASRYGGLSMGFIVVSLRRQTEAGVVEELGRVEGRSAAHMP
jgi:hypothetical protein